jgi:hypothetical protein
MITFEMFLEESDSIDSKIKFAIKNKEGHIAIKNYTIGMYNYKNDKFEIKIWDEKKYWNKFKIEKPDFNYKVLSLIDFKTFLEDICGTNINSLDLSDQTY